MRVGRGCVGEWRDVRGRLGTWTHFLLIGCLSSSIDADFFSFSFSASIFASFEHELTPLVGESDGGVDDGDSDSRVRSLFVLRQAGISKVQMSRARIGLSPPAVASTVDKYI